MDLLLNNLKFIKFKEALFLMLTSNIFDIEDKFITQKSNITFTDLFHTIVGFKELAKSIEAIKSNSNSKIIFCIEDRVLAKLATSIVTNLFKNKNKILFISNSSDLRILKKKVNLKNHLHLVLILGSVTKNFVLDLTHYGLHHIFVLNKNINYPVHGTYSVFSKMSSLNKLVFLLALIDEILNLNSNSSALYSKYSDMTEMYERHFFNRLNLQMFGVDDENVSEISDKNCRDNFSEKENPIYQTMLLELKTLDFT